jgi:hypothetical protein
MSFVRCSGPRRSLGLEPANKSFEHRLFLGKTAFDEAAFVIAEFGVQLFPVAPNVLPEHGHQGRFRPGQFVFRVSFLVLRHRRRQFSHDRQRNVPVSVREPSRRQRSRI